MSLNDLHPLQSKILCELLYATTKSFSELNSDKVSSDQFSFHLRQLCNLRLIEKTGSKYQLTTKGKEAANRFDEIKKEVEKQAKVALLIVATKVENGQKFYLVQQRLKQPFYGFYGFITGKLKWGETLEEGAVRELLEEAGLLGKAKLMGIKHKMDYLSDTIPQEDKFFFVHKATKLSGELKSDFEGGKNIWMTKEEIEGLTDLFDGVIESIKMCNQNQLAFSERKYKVKKY